MSFDLRNTIRNLFNFNDDDGTSSSPNFEALSSSNFQPWVFDALTSPSSSISHGFSTSDLNFARGSQPISGGTTNQALATTTPSPNLVSSASSALAIKLVWDSSVGGAGSSEAPFMTAVEAAAQFWVNHITSVDPKYTPTNPLVVTIDVGYGEVMGQTIPFGAISASSDNNDFISYNTYYAALTTELSNHPSPDPTLNNYITQHLPTPSQFQAATGKNPSTNDFFVTYAQEESLGLTPAYSYGQPDGWIGIAKNSTGFFGTPMNYTADLSLQTSGSISGYDAVGAAAHEISEVLGRIAGLGATLVTGTSATWTALDLDRYTANGALNMTKKSGYFSLDGGATDLANYNTSFGDAGDWSSSSPAYDSFGFFSKGHAAPVSATDLLAVAGLGFQLTSNVGSGTFV